MFHEIFNYPIPYWSNIPVPAPGCCIYPAAAMISSGWTADCQSTAAGAGGNFGNHNHITNTGFTSTLLHNNQSFLFFALFHRPPESNQRHSFSGISPSRRLPRRDAGRKKNEMRCRRQNSILFVCAGHRMGRHPGKQEVLQYGLDARHKRKKNKMPN